MLGHSLTDDSECPFQREGSDGKMGEFYNKICLAGIKMISPIALWVFPGGSVGKESACQAGDVSLIPGLRRFPGV